MIEIKQETRYKIRKHVENFAILLMIFSGISNIILSMPYAHNIFTGIGKYYTSLTHSNLEVYALLRRGSGFVLLFISYGLSRRIKMSWLIAIITLSGSMTMHFTRMRGFISPLVFSELFIITVLLLFQKDFRRRSDKVSVKKAMLISLCSVGLVLLNSAVGFFALKGQYRGLVDIWDCLLQSIQLLFFLDTRAVATTSLGIIYADVTMLFNWAFILVALFFVLKPLLFNPFFSKHDKEKVYLLVKKYGQNPMSYLALENDKSYYFGKTCEGVVAFAVAADVAVVCGDIIVSDEKAPTLLAEFMGFCRENNYSVFLLNVTDKFLALYKLMGFGSVKCGEDAYFLLSEYNLAGGKVAKVRAAINHANKAGITVSEYKLKEKRDLALEQEVNEVSKEWLSKKKGSELTFMMGGIGFDTPYDKRYFIARNQEKEILGFVVFVPFDGKMGYLADVTRRRSDAPQGVLEKIIYDSFMIFKDEGAIWGSLGLVPLANVREKDVKAGFVTKLFEYVYENFNEIYGFKLLHHAKEKYAPTHWVTRCFVYYPDAFTPQMAYALAKVQNPKGIPDYIKSVLKGKK